MRKYGVCSCCLSEMESMLHVLWSCPAANDIWLQSGLKVQKWGRSIHNFLDLMAFIQSRLSVDKIHFFLLLCGVLFMGAT